VRFTYELRTPVFHDGVLYKTFRLRKPKKADLHGALPRHSLEKPNVFTVAKICGVSPIVLSKLLPHDERQINQYAATLILDLTDGL
jgi:hypothetical protein